MQAGSRFDRFLTEHAAPALADNQFRRRGRSFRLMNDEQASQEWRFRSLKRNHAEEVRFTALFTANSGDRTVDLLLGPPPPACANAYIGDMWAGHAYHCGPQLERVLQAVVPRMIRLGSECAFWTAGDSFHPFMQPATGRAIVAEIEMGNTRAADRLLRPLEVDQPDNEWVRHWRGQVDRLESGELVPSRAHWLEVFGWPMRPPTRPR